MRKETQLHEIEREPDHHAVIICAEKGILYNPIPIPMVPGDEIPQNYQWLMLLIWSYLSACWKLNSAPHFNLSHPNDPLNGPSVTTNHFITHWNFISYSWHHKCEYSIKEQIYQKADLPTPVQTLKHERSQNDRKCIAHPLNRIPEVYQWFILPSCVVMLRDNEVGDNNIYPATPWKKHRNRQEKLSKALREGNWERNNP